MIRNQWYVILDSTELRRGRPRGVTRLGERLVLWRDSRGTAHCVADRCAHRGAALSCGELVGDQIRCPFHGIGFDGSGRAVLIPANGEAAPVPPNFRVNAYPVHEEQGFLWIFWGDSANPAAPAPEKPETPAFFEDLGPEFSYSRWIDHWNCHYTRCIENQLDVIHLPFVHRTTIGRGNATLVHGPRIEWKGNDLYVSMHNEADRGQRPLKPDELPPLTAGRFHLQFRMPHMWQNWIAERLRIFIAFVPVDEDNTLLYLRFYQSFVRFPVLRDLVNLVGKLQSIVIARQDKRVVLTQRPTRSELKMGENLVQGDLPILEYRRRRSLLKGESDGR
ncbi:MAG TPA: aromatic ring-hydroxylating dioxygenase subunit alpha [Rectinemataceae bacterium]|nr:aromatic ring-hydroxylating dioxygenase subunit alpha [Rectinemataceae bacterium]